MTYTTYGFRDPESVVMQPDVNRKGTNKSISVAEHIGFHVLSPIFSIPELSRSFRSTHITSSSYIPLLNFVRTHTLAKKVV